MCETAKNNFFIFLKFYTGSLDFLLSDSSVNKHLVFPNKESSLSLEFVSAIPSSLRFSDAFFLPISLNGT